MTMRARFLLLLGLVVLSWATIPFGLAMTWVAGRFTANRPLGGAVEWAQPGGASFEDVEFEGAAAARAAAIPVTLWFTVAGSPLA